MIFQFWKFKIFRKKRIHVQGHIVILQSPMVIKPISEQAPRQPAWNMPIVVTRFIGLGGLVMEVRHTPARERSKHILTLEL